MVDQSLQQPAEPCAEEFAENGSDALHVIRRRRPVLVDVLLLSTCYCLGMGALFGSVTVVSLVVAERVHPGFALVPPALQKTVATLVAFPGARHKNKRGFAIAAFSGCVGYALSAASVIFVEDGTYSFILLCMSYCISGMSDPFIQFLRFAAADISPTAFKPKAIAYVLAGGSFAAVLGPQLSNWMVDIVPGRRYAGSFLVASMLLLLECGVLLCIDFSSEAAEVVVEDEPAEIGKLRLQAAPQAALTSMPNGSDPAPDQKLCAIVSQPMFVLVASTATIVQLTMLSLMQICPYAMGLVGLELHQAVRVIQVHILGMYLPSFFTGHLISAFGKYPVMLVGVLVNLVAACCLQSDTSSFWTYFFCLGAIGVGWNWGFVGASSILTEFADVYSKADQAKAKGFNDLCIQLVATLGTLGTGFLTAALGWSTLAVVNAALLGVQLCVVLLLPLYLKLRMPSDKCLTKEPVSKCAPALVKTSDEFWEI